MYTGDYDVSIRHDDDNGVLFRHHSVITSPRLPSSMLFSSGVYHQGLDLNSIKTIKKKKNGLKAPKDVLKEYVFFDIFNIKNLINLKYILTFKNNNSELKVILSKCIVDDCFDKLHKLQGCINHSKYT